MLRNTDESLTRAFTRRAAQVVLVGAMAAAPLALSTGLASADTDWDELAQCESSGDWSTNTGNGFGGGLQFTDSTWRAFGGSGDPEDASRSEQIQVAERVKAEQGMNAWPTCSKKTGNTDSSANTEDSGSSGSESDSGSSDSDSSETESIAATPQAQPAKAAAGAAYTVAAGDTLSSVAAAHGVSWQSVAQNNAIADPDAISPGQQLKLG
ncbi:LysM peptidoglycan-binding domain-containing protein [Actinomycetospora callitridis]|uniref:LysM peptidoglycan-binding domain-containing protein n=1 Tax=Actinomycetospora callitridis TaxID=913944 RepID=UPI0023655BFF|nr:transglycosylase family protein [Actinomycetospora callitridis]MDD7919752.1 transglycosylase family protein [Actinomycetospora callitridis]